MEIKRIIDVEDEIRAVLADYITVYVKPLPEDFNVPSVEITAVGGNEKNEIDTFDVTLDARAENEYEAQLYLRNAIGILEKVAGLQTSALRYVSINSLFSWGKDPVRLDLAMCTARIRVVAHKETVEV